MINCKLNALKKANENLDLNKCAVSYEEILDYLNKTKGKINYKALSSLLLYESEHFNIFVRMNEISNLGKDSTSYKSYILRYGIREGTKKHKEKLKQLGTSKEDYIKKHGYEKFHYDRATNSNENRKKRYGKDWKNKEDEYLLKFKNSHSIEGYIKKYGIDEGTRLFNEKIQKYKKTNNIEEYIKKYGIDEGTRLFNEKNKKIGFKNSLQGYIQKYGKTDGIKIIREIKDNVSLGSFKKRFGDEIGTKKYNEYCLSMSDIAIKLNFSEHFKNGNPRGTSNGNYMTSKLSDQIIDLILNVIKLNQIKFDKIQTRQNELKIFDKLKNRNFYYDFCIDKKIIEIYGEFWHGSSSIFEKTEIHPITKTKIEDIHKNDEYKNNLAKKHGYEILVIWSNELKNKKDLSNKILKFLNNEK